MKKTHKWIVILMMTVLPIIVLTISFIISEISIKEVPIWAVIGIPVLILVSPFTFLLAQRRAEKKMYDVSLQKQKKTSLTILSVYIIFSAIMLIMLYCLNYRFFSAFLYALMPILPAIFIRLFFSKRKEVTEDNNQNNSGC